MQITKVISCVALVAAAPTLAQPDGGAILWQDLREGDNVETVANKLLAMPDVKRVSIHGRAHDKINIKYKRRGIRLLDTDFVIVPELESRKLISVGLGSRDVCPTEAKSEFFDLSVALSAKYPRRLHKAAIMSDLERAQRSATRSNTTMAGDTYTDGQTVAFITINFSKEAPFAEGWNCDGDIVNRAQLLVVYKSKRAYDEALAELMAQEEDEVSSVIDKL